LKSTCDFKKYTFQIFTNCAILEANHFYSEAS